MQVTTPDERGLGGEAVARRDAAAARTAGPAARPATVAADSRSRSRAPRYVLGGAAVALTVSLVGGYLFHWSWTGISAKDQLWDLLHVVVLPATLATLPLWYRTRNSHRRHWRIGLATLAAVFACLVVGGYAGGWSWTGFEGNTFWDWLDLLALPVVVASLPLWFATHITRMQEWRWAFAIAGVTFAVIVAGGYGLDWGWTGFRGNTLWDWLRLLLVPFAVPASVAWYSARAELGRRQATSAEHGAG